MKKYFYIMCVMVLFGVMSAFIYGVLSLVASVHPAVDPVCAVILFLIVVSGWSVGTRWWQYIYVDRRYRAKWVERFRFVGKK